MNICPLVACAYRGVFIEPLPGNALTCHIITIVSNHPTWVTHSTTGPCIFMDSRANPTFNRCSGSMRLTENKKFVCFMVVQHSILSRNLTRSSHWSANFHLCGLPHLLYAVVKFCKDNISYIFWHTLNLWLQFTVCFQTSVSFSL
jgi:hypothetical protein